MSFGTWARSIWRTSHRARISLVVDKIPAPGRRQKVLQRIGQVFSFAAEKGLHDQDPTFLLRKSRKKVVGNRRPFLETLPELVQLLQRVDSRGANIVHKLAVRFAALTTARPGTVTSARWDQLHLRGNRMVWIVPAHLMKNREEWSCPLSPQAMDVIETLRPFSGRSEYIFARPNRPHLPMLRNNLTHVLNFAGYRDSHCAHGFRHSFSSIMNTRHGEKRDNDAIEAQLAHVTKGVRGVYLSSDFMDRRTDLMDEWASWLAPLVPAAQVRDGGKKNLFQVRQAA